MEALPQTRRRPRFGLHLLTWLAFAILLYAIAFCQFVPQDRWLDLHNRRTEFGWPVAFVHEDYQSTMGGLQIPSGTVLIEYEFVQILQTKRGQFWLYPWSHPWPWEYGTVSVKKSALCLDFILWMAMVTSAMTDLELRLRNSGNRLQISLLNLLMLTAATATMFAVLPYSGLQNWMDPHWIQDQLKEQIDGTMTIALYPTSDWQGWCVWTPECTLVAIILCIGLICSFYAAGMLLVRLARNVTRLVIALLAKNKSARNSMQSSDAAV